MKNCSTGLAYWTQTAQNAEGHPTAASYGNGVTTTWGYDANTGFIDTLDSIKGATVIQDYQYDFDKLGNLKRRDNFLANAYETFNYDSLNRLDDATTVEGGQSLVKDYQYDALGNLTFKTGIGSYAYTYGGRPHAPTSIGAKAQTYDANGNLTSGWNFTLGQSRTITSWSSYNQPRTLLLPYPLTLLSFSYGADRVRLKQHNSNSGKLTLYIGNGLYEKTTQGSSVTHTHYIKAGGETVAIYKSATSGETLRYVHTDHLGSLTELTNETGGVDEYLSYDAWGKRRNVDWSDAAGQLYASNTKRGYTGHEHLEEAGLIHMNGRVYDPDAGRFLSPDPFINQPANPQSYNRYSYVLNNPLSYTDPSGHEIEEITIIGTPIHIRPLDLKTGLGAAFLFSNSSSSYPVVSSSFFVLTPLVPVSVNYTPTGSHIRREKTVYVNNPFVSRIPPTGVKVAGDGKGSKGLAYVDGALNYLSASSTFMKLFDRAMKAGVHIRIDESAISSYFDEKTNTVVWNPLNGNDISAGISSPAILLAHEIAHAVRYYEDPYGFETDIVPSVRSEFVGNQLHLYFGVSIEEARATGIEQQIARELGEPVRDNYRDAGSVIVGDPTFNCFAESPGCQ